MGGKPKRTALNAQLVERIDGALSHRSDVVMKKMFGGIAFMVKGHMTVGVNGNDLMARVGKHSMSDSLALPYARPMHFAGVPLAGIVYVGPKGLETNLDLIAWLNRAISFVESLPAKPKSA